MPNVNNVTLAGNLTRDVEVRYTQNDNAVAKFGLAVNTYRKDKDDRANFFDVQVWGITAENCSEYIGKGSSVLVEGSLKQERWTNQNGDNRSKVIVNARRVHFLDKPDNRQQTDSRQEVETAGQDDGDGSIPF